MRSPKLWCVLLALFCIAPGPLAFAQSAKPSDDPTQSKSTPKVATEDEVQQLRREVAELKAQIQRLVEASAVAQGGPARLVPVSYTHLDVYKRQVRAACRRRRALSLCAARAARSSDDRCDR